jgi:hypothetical protein
MDKQDNPKTTPTDRERHADFRVVQTGKIQDLNPWKAIGWD